MSAFKEYLANAPYEDNFQFGVGSKSPFGFHWANWSKTCQQQIEIHNSKKTKNPRLDELEDELKELKETKVWLKTKWKSMNSDLYSIYECYLDNRLRATWFDSKEEVFLSMNNEAGPYSTIKSMRWFDRDVYAKFVYKKLLTRPTVYRNFRLTTDLNVCWRLNGSPIDEMNVRLHQISKGGILFKVNSRSTFEKIKMSEYVEIHFDFDFFEKAASSSVDNIVKKSKTWIGKGKESRIHVDSEVLKRHSNFINSISSNGQEDYYIFMSYKDLFGEGNKLQKSEYFIKFVDKFQRYLEGHINE